MTALVRITNQLSWIWITAAILVPTVLGFLVAWPAWRKNQVWLGNIIGAGAISMAIVFLILRELSVLFSARVAAHATGAMVVAEPNDFARSAIYALIGAADLALLFMAGLRLEERARRRERALEWR